MRSCTTRECAPRKARPTAAVCGRISHSVAEWHPYGVDCAARLRSLIPQCTHSLVSCSHAYACAAVYCAKGTYYACGRTAARVLRKLSMSTAVASPMQSRRARSTSLCSTLRYVELLLHVNVGTEDRRSLRTLQHTVLYCGQAVPHRHTEDTAAATERASDGCCRHWATCHGARAVGR